MLRMRWMGWTAPGRQPQSLALAGSAETLRTVVYSERVRTTLFRFLLLLRCSRTGEMEDGT